MRLEEEEQGKISGSSRVAGVIPGPLRPDGSCLVCLNELWRVESPSVGCDTGIG